MQKPFSAAGYDRPGLLSDINQFVWDSYAIAKVSTTTMRRYPSWFLNLTTGPFLAIAPFVFLADTVVGHGNPLRSSYFKGQGYSDFVGFLVIPLMAVNLSNTVFSWIANLLKGEQRTGTLERLLVSVQFPASLFVGRAMAHMLFMSIFVTVTLGLVSIWVRPDFDIDPVAATIVVILHLAAVYGMAFALSSALMRITDSWTVQTMLTRTVIATLAGATFPITIFPGWLQIIARLFPFTWAFDMERRSLLRGKGVGGMIPDLLVLGSMTIAMWAVGLYFLQPELRHVRKTGMLGSF